MKWLINLSSFLFCMFLCILYLIIIVQWQFSLLCLVMGYLSQIYKQLMEFIYLFAVSVNYLPLLSLPSLNINNHPSQNNNIIISSYKLKGFSHYFFCVLSFKDFILFYWNKYHLIPVYDHNYHKWIVYYRLFLTKKNR